MSYSAFQEMKKQINEALEISSKAPLSLQKEVFEMLMRAIQTDGFDRNYKQEIEEKSKGFMPIKDFIEKAKPSSNIERNLCFTYFCNKIGIQPVTIEVIQACYELIGKQLTFNLQQSLRDSCSKRYQYLYLSDTNTYEIGKNAEQFISSIEEELAK